MATSEDLTTRKPTSPSGPLPQMQPHPPAEPSARPAEGEASAAVAPHAEGNAAEESKPHGPIFVSYREVKGPPLSRGGKKPTYIKRFYLVDSHGNETLAASGEDQGDAHYIYRNVDTFSEYGPLDCHNRKELVAWLDRIKKESQDAAGFHLIEDPPDQAISASPVGSPMRPNHPPYVAYRQERFAFEDGHRGQKWFLVDESGHEQLAVTAEERETRDGHYTYKAEGPLAQIRPLMASNMGMVTEWLDQMIQHPSDPHLESQAMSGGRPDRGKAGTTPSSTGHRRAKPSLSDHSQPSKKPPPKRTLADHLHAEEAKRQKLQPQEGTEAGDKELVALRLRKLAAEESVLHRTACKAAMEWVQAPPPADQTMYLQFWMSALRTAVANLARLSDKEDGIQPMLIDQNGNANRNANRNERAPTRAAALLDVLEALREVGAHHFSLPMLAGTGVAKDLIVLRQHEIPSIAKLATRILQQLQTVTAGYITVLTRARFLADPVPAAEAALRGAAAKFAARAPPPQAQVPSSLVRGVAAQLNQPNQATQSLTDTAAAPAAMTPASGFLMSAGRFAPFAQAGALRQAVPLDASMPGTFAAAAPLQGLSSPVGQAPLPFGQYVPPVPQPAQQQPGLLPNASTS